MGTSLRRVWVSLTILFSVIAWVCWTDAADLSRCGQPPPPKPAQRSGAESVPPLPLPATPQRRTEKKKPPTPPVLVVRILSNDPADWPSDPNAVNNLLLWMQSQMGVTLGHEEKRFWKIDWDDPPPMLYRSGHVAFSFTDRQRQALRRYVLDGGFIYLDTCWGRSDVVESTRRELAAIFPERKLRELPPDHPLYHCYHDIAQVHYSPESEFSGPAPPPLEGIDIGCRTGVVFSTHDLSCGWDMHACPGAGVAQQHALQLGANIVAYATATRPMAASLAASRVYVDGGESRADKFRVGQVIHDGQWNPDPSGLAALLDKVTATTSLKVSFATQPLKLTDQDLGFYPFLYMTGHDKFEFSDAEVTALRGHLNAGGFLLAEACCGRRSFDAAFRAQMQRVLVQQPLGRLPGSHSLYTIYHEIEGVHFTQAAIASKGFRNPGAPVLEAITVDGELGVVYSPYGMNCGWQLRPNPYAAGYESRDAIKLGVNVVIYAVTH